MRKTVALLGFLAFASPAAAIPIVPTDLDTLVIGPNMAHTVDPFNAANPPPIFTGILDSQVFFDGATYTYVSTVIPFLNDNSHFNTAFSPAGFTGQMGWSFSDAFSAGGTGTGIDFFTASVNGHLHWLALDRGMGDNWDSGEAIQFYFRSTRPPTVGDYNLLNGEASTASGFAPVPEPGTIALFGSGLYGMWKLRKRTKDQKKLALS